MNNFAKRMTLALMLLGAVALVGAQGGQGGGQGQGQGRRGGQFGRMGQRGGGFGTSELQLAFREDVQKEIGVNDDQKKKLDDLKAKQPQRQRGNRTRGNRGGAGTAGGTGTGTAGGTGTTGGSATGAGTGTGTAGGNGGRFGNGGTPADREAAMKRFQEQQDQQKKDLAAILDEKQMKRLDEIAFQQQGTRALTRETTQKALGLSSDQVAKIKDLLQKQQDANRSVMEKMQSQELTQEEARAAFDKNTKTLDEQLLKILTDEQSAKFKDMQGKPFKIEGRGNGGGR
jgi:hypothetical protein